MLSLRIPDEVTFLEGKIEGPATKAHTVNLMEYQRGVSASGWRTFAIPLASLGDVDVSQIAIIGLWNPRGKTGAYVACEVLVDDIHFE